MAEDESYEIMPYKEIVNLKKEIENLKKKTGTTSSEELINSMAKLTKSMDTMLQLFRTAADEMKAEETTEEKFAAKIEPLIDKLDEVIEQNKTIAEGMVAIADIVKGKQIPESRVRTRLQEPRVSESGLESSKPGELPPLGLLPVGEPSFGVPEAPQFPSELPPLQPLRAPPIPPRAPPMPPPRNLPPLGPPGAPPPFAQEKPKKKGLFGLGKK